MSAHRDMNEPTAAEMANLGAEKELEGYAYAFAARDELKAQEEAAQRSREESREQRKKASRSE